MRSGSVTHIILMPIINNEKTVFPRPAQKLRAKCQPVGQSGLFKVAPFER
jgi:hypothetical protein